RSANMSTTQTPESVPAISTDEAILRGLQGRVEQAMEEMEAEQVEVSVAASLTAVELMLAGRYMVHDIHTRLQRRAAASKSRLVRTTELPDVREANRPPAETEGQGEGEAVLPLPPPPPERQETARERQKRERTEQEETFSRLWADPLLLYGPADYRKEQGD